MKTTVLLQGAGKGSICQVRPKTRPNTCLDPDGFRVQGFGFRAPVLDFGYRALRFRAWEL